MSVFGDLVSDLKDELTTMAPNARNVRWWWHGDDDGNLHVCVGFNKSDDGE